MTGDAPRAVIAGGSGFIGRELTRLLLASGYLVTILSRAPRESGDPRLRHAVWDGAGLGDWAREIDGAQIVVNLAGADIAGARWTRAYKDVLRRSRLDSSLALTKAVAAAETRPSVVVQASAVGYYGNRENGDEPSDESAPRGEGFLAGLAGDWESAGAGLEALGVRRCLIRTGLVLGRGGILARLLPAFKLYAGAVIGSGRQGFPFIHVADEARAILFLASNPACSGAYNLTAPQTPDHRAFCLALGRALSRPVLFRVPGFAVEAVLGEMGRELLLSGCFARPARLTGAGFTFGFPTLEAALADILGAAGDKRK